MTEPRYVDSMDGTTACEECGVVVKFRQAHTRFHSILNGHAWALSVLKIAHIADHVHNKYEVTERIDSRHFDSWTNEALDEVLGEKKP